MDLNLLAAIVFGGALIGVVLLSLFSKGAGGRTNAGTNKSEQEGGDILFIDCDDTLYRNENWEVAKMITENIEAYVTDKLHLPSGKAYELYKKHGTALRGLQMEKIDFDLDDFLKTVHDLPDAKKYIKQDAALRDMLNSVSVDKWVFTASTREHATNCMNLLGVARCFSNPVIDVRAAKFNTKHSPECYKHAMRIANVREASQCYIVDDSWSNIKTAKEMGWNTALVGLKSRDGKDATKYPHADHVIADLKELPRVWPHLFRDESKDSKQLSNGTTVKKRKSSKGKRRKAD
eukprot:CAMPEP_0114526392 /NCGR_PEP_ID=MMETSP0109-20121206/22992_1 /TAXON_ID=29199 /ORGANISM="Chlorarachnion reptans, Strain CCCM449" /LENGTH=290 /DNA_ID=CAMNT_0001708155 /DNA_START=35 /DNA_END=907 /DNA_ORIENTATION=-